MINRADAENFDGAGSPPAYGATLASFPLLVGRIERRKSLPKTLDDRAG
jgi:hypothetical protein